MQKLPWCCCAGGRGVWWGVGGEAYILALVPPIGTYGLAALRFPQRLRVRELVYLRIQKVQSREAFAGRTLVPSALHMIQPHWYYVRGGRAWTFYRAGRNSYSSGPVCKA